MVAEYERLLTAERERLARHTTASTTERRDHRACLVRITARQALNRPRTGARRKKAHVGPWLPEPLLTAPDVAEDVELAESLSDGADARP